MMTWTDELEDSQAKAKKYDIGSNHVWEVNEIMLLEKWNLRMYTFNSVHILLSPKYFFLILT